MDKGQKEMDDKTLNALHKAETVQWARVSAFVIIKDGKYGKIKIAFPKTGEGKLQVWVWDSNGFAGYGVASSTGYDKLSAALGKIEYDGERMEVNTPGCGEWQDNLHNRGYTVIQAI